MDQETFIATLDGRDGQEETGEQGDSRALFDDDSLAIEPSINQKDVELGEAPAGAQHLLFEELAARF